MVVTRRGTVLGLLCALAATSACRREPASPPRPADPVVPGAAPSRTAEVIPGQAVAAPRDLPLDDIRLPEGLAIGVYAAPVENARSMTVSPQGTLYVGSRKAGKVYAIPNRDGDARGDRVITLASGLREPNGVAFHQGALYVAEVSRVLRFDGIEETLDHPPAPAVVNAGFPDDAHHGWKFIGIGPDRKLYVPVGAPCNVCEEKDPRYASILRMNLDGSAQEVFARGVRNTVGFDWHPTTGHLWFTENGRDRMGDDIPPDELDVASKPGLHFGFPYCHAGTIADPEHGSKRACASTEPPAGLLGPHVAALGMRFYTGKSFPAEYHGKIFIAEHGSWNRSKKLGYRIMLAGVRGSRMTSYEVFAEGWLQGERAWGRPVDVQPMRDGALLVSDDEAGAIYRIHATR